MALLIPRLAFTRASGPFQRCWLSLAITLWFFWAMPGFGQVIRAPEFPLKAAYIINFTQFVEWPSNRFESAEAPVVIGVLGEDPFGPTLDQAVKDKSIAGRMFEVRRSRQLGDLRGCHVLFISLSEAKRLPEILAALQNKNVLTVSDIDRFAEQGGVINFYMENNKVRFRINVSAARRARIKISSQLLRLGAIVREKGDAEY
jgi:hypothetical protein